MKTSLYPTNPALTKSGRHVDLEYYIASKPGIVHTHHLFLYIWYIRLNSVFYLLGLPLVLGKIAERWGLINCLRYLYNRPIQTLFETKTNYLHSRHGLTWANNCAPQGAVLGEPARLGKRSKPLLEGLFLDLGIKQIKTSVGTGPWWAIVILET